MKGLAAWGLAATALLGVAAPAARAAAPSGGWTDPTPDALADGHPLATIDDLRPLSGWVERPGGIDRVEFALVDDAGGACSAADEARSQTIAGGTSRVEFAFPAAFPCNRRYSVRVTAVPHDDGLLQHDPPLVLDLALDVAVAPAAVDDLVARQVDHPSPGVLLRWTAPAPEPDLVGYAIHRQVVGGASEILTVAAPGTSTYTDASLPAQAADVSYEVVAVRSGPEPGVTVPADANPVVTVPWDPAPAVGAAAIGPTGRSTVSGVRSVAVPRATPTTVDTGFQAALPFSPGDRMAMDSSPGGGRAQRAVAVVVAAAALAAAIALRRLCRRAVRPA